MNFLTNCPIYSFTQHFTFSSDLSYGEPQEIKNPLPPPLSFLPTHTQTSRAQVIAFLPCNFFDLVVLRDVGCRICLYPHQHIPSTTPQNYQIYSLFSITSNLPTGEKHTSFFIVLEISDILWQTNLQSNQTHENINSQDNLIASGISNSNNGCE